MSRHRHKPQQTLAEKYPPSPPCSCDTCRSYCRRPGWWTVDEAARALEAGYGARMMLEMAPGFRYGVLSPAFKGCETQFAFNEFASNGCTFLADERCELHGTGHQPLECASATTTAPGWDRAVTQTSKRGGTALPGAPWLSNGPGRWAS